MTATQIHPFERRGLGLAPFRCIGHERRVGPIRMAGGYEVGAPGQPMGTCDFCGTGIADCFIIRSADGKQFIVGSDCVAKTSRDSLVGATDLQREVLRIKRDLARDKRDAKRQAELDRLKPEWDRARAALVADPALFADRPHPAFPGKTLRDYYAWLLDNAGAYHRNVAATAILYPESASRAD